MLVLLLRYRAMHYCFIFKLILELVAARQYFPSTKSRIAKLAENRFANLFSGETCMLDLQKPLSVKKGMIFLILVTKMMTSD